MMYKPHKSLINRLLMVLDPLFFSYSELEQNQRRQHFHYNQDDEIYAFLYRELFKLEYDPEEEEDVLDEGQVHLLNAYSTALVGIGDNAFRLCELQGEEFDLCAFNSLYDYDLDAFNYQQQAMKKDFSDSFIEREYRLYLNHNWVRILDAEGDFYYSTLSSLSYFITDELSESMRAIIQTLIPYELVESDQHGKNVEGGMLWDFKTEANGLEAELEELESRGRTYVNDIHIQLDKELHGSTSNEVYFLKQNDDIHGPFWNVIINNADTAKKIRFEHYLADCLPFVQSNERLDALKASENAKLKQFLVDAHQDILANFDPTVVRFKKKMKVVMTPGALDDLSRLSSTDDDE